MLHRKWLERHYSDRNGSKWVQLKVGVAVDHFDLPDEARHARIENRFLLRSASLPPQHAQHRRALGTPEMRAGLRRKEGYLLSLPSIYEPVCAQEPRPHWLDPFASLRAGYAGLLSFAPVGAGSSPV